jgi:hypothetical protein
MGDYPKGQGHKKVGLDDLFAQLHVNGHLIKKNVLVRLEFLNHGKMKTKQAMLAVIQDVLEHHGVPADAIKSMKLDTYLLADYLLNIEAPKDKKKAKAIQKMQFALRRDPFDYIRTKFDKIEMTGCGVFSGSYTPCSSSTLYKLFQGWDAMMDVLEAKKKSVMHLPPSQWTAAAMGLTPSELAWAKVNGKKLGIL